MNQIECFVRNEFERQMAGSEWFFEGAGHERTSEEIFDPVFRGVWDMFVDTYSEKGEEAIKEAGAEITGEAVDEGEAVNVCETEIKRVVSQCVDEWLRSKTAVKM